MISQYLEQVSSFAHRIDSLIMLIAVLVGFWFILCQGVFFYFIFKFKAKPGVKAEYITGEEKEQKRWISIPHYLVLFCDLFIIYGAINIWYDVKQNIPEDPYATIRIVGQQWAWSFVHPGADGKLGTPDDIKTVDELHIEANQVYAFELESRDVMHSFSVPVFRLKQDAIPGRVVRGWFDTNKEGDHDIQCAEICGIGHGIMAARIHIESAADHQSWIAQNSPTSPNATPTTQLAAASSPRAVALRN